MIEELARHGYRVGPRTRYPLLRGMEEKGYPESRQERAGRSVRRVCTATPMGREALAAARKKVRQPSHEILEES